MSQAKKIAFIGCSHFSALEQPSQGTNNWTYLFHKKYPNHICRNYSQGGKGIEYFQWALLDAKRWGADIVFMLRTYPGRWATFAETSNEGQSFKFRVTNEEHNWKELAPGFEIMWGSANSGPNHCVGAEEGEAVNYNDNIIAKLETSVRAIPEYFFTGIAGAKARLTWEIQWYSEVESMYNFENIFLVEWGDTHQLHGRDYKCTTTYSDNVMDHLVTKFNVPTNTPNPAIALYEAGLVVAVDDHHLSLKGNIALLEYITSPDIVKNAIS